MAVYIYDCASGHEFVSPTYGLTRCEQHPDEPVRRNYRREGASFHVPMHMSSRNTSNKSDFLPTTKDFESPQDPTGERGMDNWKATHQLVGKKELI